MDGKMAEENLEPGEGPSTSRPVFKNPTPTPGQGPDDEFYDMTHENRGIALIFNHYHFDSLLEDRVGTEFDRDAMEATLKKLKFCVKVYNDLTGDEIMGALGEVSEMDHSQNDCLVIAVMSHGTCHGRLYARDSEYTIHELVGFFSGDKCSSLAGKPKLFFLQACKGEMTDSGVEMKFETDSINSNKTTVYSMPVMADILIMCATVEEYVAWRVPTQGSWFIQTLVQMLENHHENRDLLSILTIVNRKVGVNFLTQSIKTHKHAKKQMCSIYSMLTRLLYFN